MLIIKELERVKYTVEKLIPVSLIQKDAGKMTFSWFLGYI
jgi:hypothetical protein